MVFVHLIAYKLLNQMILSIWIKEYFTETILNDFYLFNRVLSFFLILKLTCYLNLFKFIHFYYFQKNIFISLNTIYLNKIQIKI